MQVNIIIVPNMVQLDITGPYEVLARVPGWKVDLVAASPDPVRTDRGLTILPTRTRETAAPADLLVVPGGAGVDDILLDREWIAFAGDQAQAARHVFGICTGAFLLAMTGLLDGRRAGAHWQTRDLLKHFGVVPSSDRIVTDGKFVTSGGVTSGIDAALCVVAEIEGQAAAQRIQLAIEYDPQPPFSGGTPSTSPPEIIDDVLAAGKPRRASREALMIRASGLLRELEKERATQPASADSNAGTLDKERCP